mgnify:CR=1 FL=1
MSKLTEDDKNKVRNFMMASLPDLENVRKHITQCGLATDKIVSIAMTGDGYISIDFHQFDGASVYRGDICGPVKLKFEEKETLEVQR